MGLEIINELKKKKNLTNAQLAEKAGITLSTIDKITAGINNNPKLNTLKAICQVLECTLDDFSDKTTDNKELDLNLTEDEQKLIKAYRKYSEMQSAVNKLLNIHLSDENIDSKSKL